VVHRSLASGRWPFTQQQQQQQQGPQRETPVHGAACRMGPHGAAWGHMACMGPVPPKAIPGKKERKGAGRLLFAALALGQQPTGTAIKVPHPC
jgi:hypothetical protein